MSFEVKPELASGFLMVGAPVMVADAETEAAAGNVGLMGPIPDDEAPDVMGPLYRKQNKMQKPTWNWTDVPGSSKHKWTVSQASM